MTPRREEAGSTRRRTAVLLFHLAAEAIAIVGVLLSWKIVLVGESVVTDTVGSDMREGKIVFLASLMAFFFASYDLVADADIQLPVLLASAIAVGAAGYALYDVLWCVSTFRETAEALAVAGIANPDSATHAGGAKAIRGQTEREAQEPVVTVGGRPVRGGPPLLAALRLRTGTGLIMSLVGAFDMLLASLYLTVFATREKSG
jgi:hypothetical protein